MVVVVGREMGFFFLVILSLLAVSTSGSLNRLPILSFDDGYTHLFGENNVFVNGDGKSVRLLLDERTGSGFVSHDLYLYGFFSASIKLPADYTAGVVVAFYMSNGDMFEKNHDEIDFEFLGNIRGKDWRIQTNIYGNGSTGFGREERYNMGFDPSDDFHRYSIHWTDSQIIFYIDNVPIREFKKTASLGGGFPSKPMSVYVTIWDGSDWATNGGKYRVNYKYAPYVAHFSDFILHGCAVDPIQELPTCDSAQDLASIHNEITSSQRSKMDAFRRRHMTYSYCYDKTRYKVPPTECRINPAEAKRLKAFDPVTFGGGRRRHGKHNHHRTLPVRSESQAV